MEERSELTAEQRRHSDLTGWFRDTERLRWYEDGEPTEHTRPAPPGFVDAAGVGPPSVATTGSSSRSRRPVWLLLGAGVAVAVALFAPSVGQPTASEDMFPSPPAVTDPSSEWFCVVAAAVGSVDSSSDVAALRWAYDHATVVADESDRVDVDDVARHRARAHLADNQDPELRAELASAAVLAAVTDVAEDRCPVTP